MVIGLNSYFNFEFKFFIFLNVILLINESKLNWSWLLEFFREYDPLVPLGKAEVIDLGVLIDVERESSRYEPIFLLHSILAVKEFNFARLHQFSFDDSLESY
jgi:hypothetical protein